MKHFFALFLLLLLPLQGLKAQEIAYEDIEKAVIAYNSVLPLSLGSSVQLTSMAISEEELTVTLSLLEVGGARVRDFDENARELAKSIFSSNDEETRAYFEAVALLGISFRIVAQGESTGEKVEVRFSPEEMLEICHQEVDPMATLRGYVKQQQTSLPLRLNEWMEISSVSLLEQGTMEIVYTLDENFLNSLDESALRSSLSSAISQDISLAVMASLCYDAGYGLAFVYQSISSDQQLRVAFTPAQLFEFLPE